GHDGYRTPGAVVAWISDELIVHREAGPAGELRKVVGFDDGLGTVAQPTVAELETESSGRQVVGVGIAQAVGGDADAEAIVSSTPRAARDLRTDGGGPIGFRVAERLRGAIVPAKPSEESRVGILGEWLLDVQRESVLDPIRAPCAGDVGCPALACREGEGV